MKKSAQDYRAIMRGHEAGLSLRNIGTRFGYLASSVKRVLDIASENGEVVMIDYSGDGVTYIDNDGKSKKAEIFVAVLACSDASTSQ